MLKITEYRKEKGLTQYAIAKELNMSIKKLGAWEQGRAEPCIADMCLLADFFDCSLDELVGRVQTDSIQNGKGLTPQENTLLTKFRNLSEKEKIQTLNIINVLRSE